MREHAFGRQREAQKTPTQLTVDLNSARPIFEQIAFAVKEAMARGELRPGSPLPSVRKLAHHLSVNPNTVVRAYELLSRDGAVVRRQGAGCFVSGRASALAGKHRRGRLLDLMWRAVTEAFHLGFHAEDVRMTLAQALSEIDFDERPRACSLPPCTRGASSSR